MYTLPAVVRDDLSWYFGESESACGVRSNIGPALERARLGYGVSINTVDNMSWERLEAAFRRGEIEAILRKIGPVHTDVLTAAYEPRQFPPDLLREYAETANIAVRLMLTRKMYAKAQKAGYDGTLVDWLTRVVATGSTEEKQAIEPIAKQATGLLTAAYRAYERALRG